MKTDALQTPPTLPTAGTHPGVYFQLFSGMRGPVPEVRNEKPPVKLNIIMIYPLRMWWFFAMCLVVNSRLMIRFRTITKDSHRFMGARTTNLYDGVFGLNETSRRYFRKRAKLLGIEF